MTDPTPEAALRAREAIANTLMDLRMDGPKWKPPSTLTYQEAMREYADILVALPEFRALATPSPDPLLRVIESALDRLDHDDTSAAIFVLSNALTRPSSRASVTNDPYRSEHDEWMRQTALRASPVPSEGLDRYPSEICECGHAESHHGWTCLTCEHKPPYATPSPVPSVEAGRLLLMPLLRDDALAGDVRRAVRAIEEAALRASPVPSEGLDVERVVLILQDMGYSLAAEAFRDRVLAAAESADRETP